MQCWGAPACIIGRLVCDIQRSASIVVELLRKKKEIKKKPDGPRCCISASGMHSGKLSCGQSTWGMWPLAGE